LGSIRWTVHIPINVKQITQWVLNVNRFWFNAIRALNKKPALANAERNKPGMRMALFNKLFEVLSGKQKIVVRLFRKK
jgi:hypothetical protein